MGVGAAELLNCSADAKWLVVEVDSDKIVDLGDMVKFSHGIVIYAGDRLGATRKLIELGADPAVVPGAVIIAGQQGTAVAGRRATAIAGSGGTATAGHCGTAIAGDYGTATAGHCGSATAGEEGIIQIRWYDRQAERYRIAIGYIGENGLLPNVAYRLDETYEFVAVEK
jgi:hypothetical protein